MAERVLALFTHHLASNDTSMRQLCRSKPPTVGLCTMQAMFGRPTRLQQVRCRAPKSDSCSLILYCVVVFCPVELIQYLVSISRPIQEWLKKKSLVTFRGLRSAAYNLPPGSCPAMLKIRRYPAGGPTFSHYLFNKHLTCNISLLLCVVKTCRYIIPRVS